MEDYYVVYTIELCRKLFIFQLYAYQGSPQLHDTQDLITEG